MGEVESRGLGNYKFRRQVTLGSIIVDFCCFEKRIVIELDGQPHLNNKSFDGIRDEFLDQYGDFKVIRIWNSEIKKDIEKVINKILNHLESPSSVQHLREYKNNAGHLLPSREKENRS